MEVYDANNLIYSDYDRHDGSWNPDEDYAPDYRIVLFACLCAIIIALGIGGGIVWLWAKRNNISFSLDI